MLPFGSKSFPAATGHAPNPCRPSRRWQGSAAVCSRSRPAATGHALSLSPSLCSPCFFSLSLWLPLFLCLLPLLLLLRPYFLTPAATPPIDRSVPSPIPLCAWLCGARRPRRSLHSCFVVDAPPAPPSAHCYCRRPRRHYPHVPRRPRQALCCHQRSFSSPLPASGSSTRWPPGL